ncbi:MAG: hypothetical protein AAFQ09_03495 [Pseudomonadota bacterium]
MTFRQRVILACIAAGAAVAASIIAVSSDYFGTGASTVTQDTAPAVDCEVQENTGDGNVQLCGSGNTITVSQ